MYKRQVFDWSLARGMGRSYFLAGGLGIGNLAEAIRILSPWAVDLSSGVETDGDVYKRQGVSYNNCIDRHSFAGWRQLEKKQTIGGNDEG